MPETWAPTGRSAHEDSFAAEHLPPATAWPEIDYRGLPELAAYPAQMNCAVELLDRQAARFPDRPAIRAPGLCWSYAELRSKADAIAHVLRDDLGVRPGNRVMLRSPNNPMAVACWFAVMKAGAIAVATMPLLRARELSYIAEAAEVALALCDARLEEELAVAAADSDYLSRVVCFDGAAGGDLEAMAAAHDRPFDNVDTAADDVCLIAFTSGTTGPPKGCMHFHRDVLAICDTFSRYVLRPGPEDIFAGTPPLAFTFGLGALVAFPMHAGASTLLIESYTPESLIEALDAHQVSILFTAPTMYRALTPALRIRRLPALRQCVSAGETLPKASYEDWFAATGIRIIDGLGATELLHIFIATAGDEIRAGATGKAIPGYEATVLDDNGNAVDDGVIGRLAVRGPTGCRYLQNPERQAAYVQNGWNLTGDAYKRDADGYYWYQARTDDMIISAGYNISGPEVEAVLLEHAAVADCAVIGATDPERGQIVKAFVVLREPDKAEPTTVKALQDHVKATIAPYKYPRAIAFVAELPRTQTGKLQRFVLCDEEAAGAAADTGRD